MEPGSRVHHQYSILLALILLALAVQLAAPEGEGARIAAVTLQAVTLFAAVVISRAHRWVIRATAVACAVLVLGSIAAVLGTEALGEDSARIVALLLIALAPPAIVLGMRKHFRDEDFITVQTMFGVLCIYLLVGDVFGSLFAAIQAVSDDPFFASGTGDTSDFLYFSFATLTTVGYGDLVAATNLGRSLAITEALIGQIYMVTVVALIVSNIGSPTRRRTRA